MMPEPSFFIIHRSAYNRLPSVSVERTTEPGVCRGCGRLRAFEHKAREYQIEIDGGSIWPDILYERYRRGVVLSSRVVDSLRAAANEIDVSSNISLFPRCSLLHA